MHGVRDAQVRVNAALLRDRTRHLLQEKWIAFRLLEDESGDGLGHAVRRDDRPHDAEAVRRRQAVERELRGIGLLDPAGAVPGPERCQQQDPRAGEALGERLQVFLRGPVDPVRVLDRENDRPPLAAVQAHLAQCLERARLDGLLRLRPSALRAEFRRTCLEPRPSCSDRSVRLGGLSVFVADHCGTKRAKMLAMRERTLPEKPNGLRRVP